MIELPEAVAPPPSTEDDSEFMKSLYMKRFSYVRSYVLLRPLIAFDKINIIDISKKIDTYETSILPYEDCCTVFLPKYPAIRPNLDKVIKSESNLDVEALIEQAMLNIEKIEL